MEPVCVLLLPKTLSAWFGLVSYPLKSHMSWSIGVENTSLLPMSCIPIDSHQSGPYYTGEQRPDVRRWLNARQT